MDRQRIGLWGTFIFAALAVIGMNEYRSTSSPGSSSARTDGWTRTRTWGMLTHLFYVLTFLAALVGAWPNWRATALPFLLALIGSAAGIPRGRR